MPDHPRKRVKGHINLTREFVSPTAGCMMVNTEPDLEFGPSTERRKEDLPGISDRLVEQEKKELNDVLDEFQDLMHGKPGYELRWDMPTQLVDFHTGWMQ